MKKSYLILVGVIVFGLALVLMDYFSIFDRGTFRPFLLYPDFDPVNISRIEISYLLDGAELEKKDGEWSVSEMKTAMRGELDQKEGRGEAEKIWYRADGEKVEGLLDIMKNLMPDVLSSDNPEKGALFQIGEVSKKIIAYDVRGAKAAELYIGKTDPVMLGTYVRRGGDSNIYLVKRHLGAEAPSDILSWRDKTIWSVRPDEIRAVDVVKGGSRFGLLKDEGGVWQAADAAEMVLDGKKVEEFIEKISDIRASRFAYPVEGESAGVNPPSITLSITVGDGSRKTLLVGAVQKQGYVAAQLEGGEEIYLLDSDFESHIPDKLEEFSSKD